MIFIDLDLVSELSTRKLKFKGEDWKNDKVKRLKLIKI